MQVLGTKQQKKQEFLDSIYIISHSTKTVQMYTSGIHHFQKFLDSKYGIDEEELVTRIKSDVLDVYSVFQSF